jgi:hypothetical protein
MVSTLMLAACGGSTPTAGATSAVTSQAATSAGAAATSAGAAATSAGAAATSPAAAAGAAPDACSLITSQEASVALGVDAGTPSAAGGTGTCDYGTANGSSIHIIVSLYPDSSTAQSLYAASRTAAKGGQPGVQDVSGIGDMAFVTPGGFMEFSKGSTVVIIQVGSSANPSTSAMTTLGQAAAGRV